MTELLFPTVTYLTTTTTTVTRMATPTPTTTLLEFQMMSPRMSHSLMRKRFRSLSLPSFVSATESVHVSS